MSGKPRKKIHEDVVTEFMWRAILRDPAVEWQQMSVITRGIADEILRRVERGRDNASPGQIVASPGRTIYEAIYSAIGALPKERQRVADAIDELVEKRWAAIDDTKFVAFFPDLGAERPTTVLRSGEAERRNRAKILKSGPGEEKRREENEEETRGEATEPARDPIVWRVVDIALRAEFKKHGIVFTDLVGPSWTKVVNWVIDFAAAASEPSSRVIECLCRGFAKNQKARLHGYPLSYVVTNPRQFFDEGARETTTAETYDDEDHPL